MPGVLRLVGTIVGAFVPRNFRSSYKEGAKLKIKTQGVLLNFFSKGWTLIVYSIPGVPKKTIHCLISCDVKSIKAISLK